MPLNQVLPYFTFKCPVLSLEYDSYYQIVRFLCVGVLFSWTSVITLFLSFPLIVNVCPSVLVCNPDLFFLNRPITFERFYLYNHFTNTKQNCNTGKYDEFIYNGTLTHCLLLGEAVQIVDKWWQTNTLHITMTLKHTGFYCWHVTKIVYDWW